MFNLKNMAFSQPQTQPLPISPFNRGDQETVATNHLNYWQEYHRQLSEYRNRNLGGSGFDFDEIANRAIRSQHYAPNVVEAGNPLSTISIFGNVKCIIMALGITTTFANAEVFLNAQACHEIIKTGTNLVKLSIERSTTSNFATTTEIAGSFHCSQQISAFNYITQNISNRIDKLVTPGAYFYRLIFIHEANNSNSASGLTGYTLNVQNPAYTFLNAVITNQRS